MEAKFVPIAPIALKTFQIAHAEDGSHLAIYFYGPNGGISFAMESEYAKRMGEELIKQANLLQPGKKATD